MTDTNIPVGGSLDFNGQKSSKIAPLLSLIQSLQGQSLEPGAVNLTLGTAAISTLRDGFVVIDAVSSTGRGADLLPELTALGLQQGSTYGAVVSGLLPIGSVGALEAVGTLRFATPSFQVANVGQALNQGVDVMNVADAFAAFGVDDSGIRIGVLSDSFNALGAYATDILTGDLPPNVVVLEDLAGGNLIDEGRAMLQLIHDVAPGAELAFNTAFTGQAGFANGILALRAAGSDIIVDDVGYFAAPFYSDGIVAQAATTVANDGALYFSSAGNDGRQAYESLDGFRASGVFEAALGGAELHDFDPGVGVDTRQLVQLGRGSTVISLQWDDPFFSATGGRAGATADLDLVVYFNGQPLFVQAVNNLASGDPVEIIGLTVGGPANGLTNIEIGIGRFSGVDPGRFKVLVSGTANIAEWDTRSPTVWGQSAAEGAVAVGASWWQRTPDGQQALPPGVPPQTLPVPQVNGFSSAGPATILFDWDGNRLATPDVRGNPAFTAADGVSTTTTTLPTFFGTSAAAPNAAAVAALLLEADRSLDLDDTLEALQSTAIDVQTRFIAAFSEELETGLVGFDDVSGAGLIQADAALDYVIAQSPLGPLNLSGGNNNDELVGGTRNDTLNGGNGQDTLFGGIGNDFLLGGGGDDLVYGQGGNDNLNGRTGQDTLVGGGGNDFLSGGLGDDLLDGGSGNDRIDGSEGQDRIVTGNGNDTVIGGNGDDTFVFEVRANSTTVITDFRFQNDRLEFFNPAITSASVADVDNDGRADLTLGLSAPGQSLILLGVGADAFLTINGVRTPVADLLPIA